MDKGKNKAPRKPNLMLWSAVGVYLVYLGWDMIKTYINAADKSAQFVFLLIGIFFAVVGAALLVMALRRYNADKAGAAPPPEDTGADAAGNANEEN